MPHDLKQTGANVIQTCLGDAFDRLPDTVQRGHAGKIRLDGYARVTRGNPIANMVAAVMGLPAATERGAMSVEGEHLPDRMIWNRQFGDRQFRSCFTLDRGRLFESLGPFRLYLRLEARDRRLCYVLEHATLFGLPVPRILAPHLEAWEGERDGRYEFAVEVRLPVIGRLVRYEGLLELAA
jgi:Domain of unknown function (DUF4166)